MRDQKGAIQFIFLIILLAGIIAGVYLVQQTQIFKPKAASEPINTPQTSMTVVSQLSSYKVGDTIETKVLVRSDIEPANLFAAKLKFDKDLIAVEKIDTSASFIKNWVEQAVDKNTGTISLVGGVPNPGFQTNVSSPPAPMAKIYFRALKTGIVVIAPLPSSIIFSNASNINILTIRNDAIFKITSGLSRPLEITPSPTPTEKPSATPKQTTIPIPDIGDGNNDGKIDLTDLSILFSSFNKTGGFSKYIDLNGDGSVNTFDFSLIRNLLIQKGVIQG
ncbi:hypothetical protein HYS94_04940 [Candidatus Daviesbacteria bacterium]|nr:hypothetical protein [Candidatus Daviesbacteria bacterium]